MASELKNHIKAKFLGIDFAPIPQETFSDLATDLINALRELLPRHLKKELQELVISVDSNPAAQRFTDGHQIYMVDATGLWGLKINNQSMSLSTAKYVSYEEAVDYMGNLATIIKNVLRITHFSRVSLRNINLFDQSSTDSFEDVMENRYWGAHEFPTLKGQFTCSGAATRHEYFSQDWQRNIQLVSGVILGDGRSYIPREEWDIWQIRGKIPVEQGDDIKLMIDISGNSFEAPVNDPELNNVVTEFEWEAVRDRFDNLHQLVNQVYADIIN